MQPNNNNIIIKWLCLFVQVLAIVGGTVGVCACVPVLYVGRSFRFVLFRFESNQIKSNRTEPNRTGLKMTELNRIESKRCRGLSGQ